MKEIKNINDYQEIINGNKPVLLDFYADWCGPCQTQLPIVENVAQKHEEDVVVAKINVDQNRELAQQFNIRSIPAIFFIKDGQIKEQFVGLKTEAELTSVIQQHLSAETT